MKRALPVIIAGIVTAIIAVIVARTRHKDPYVRA